MAGLQGLFAIERDKMAFETLETNLLKERGQNINKFSWPLWLEQKAWSIDDLLAQHTTDLIQLRGTVQILAGGPPCQGFSFAGRRQETDPRNLLFEKYVEAVTAIRPSALILENVPGMKVGHVSKELKALGFHSKSQSAYEKLLERLDAAGYCASGQLVDSSKFGVPQKRTRLIVIGIKKELAQHLPEGAKYVFKLLEDSREQQLKVLGIPTLISAQEALSDLEYSGKPNKACTDSDSRSGFQEYPHFGPQTTFQKLMHHGCENIPMDSMRLAKHRPHVRERFQRIIAECPKGVVISPANREKFGIKKHRIVPLLGTAPSPTLTTLPDDLLHYCEPRILTVRESARLQSFPDWFQFRGKFTTGGKRRTKECPRYTQVGNAVPPLLGRAIGLAVMDALAFAEKATSQPQQHLVEEN